MSSNYSLKRHSLNAIMLIFLRAYTLKGIEIAAGIDRRVFLTNEGLPYSPPAADFNSIADLYGFVKQYDKDFVAGREVSPLMLNEDGTPITAEDALPDCNYQQFFFS